MNATIKETFNLDLSREELELLHDSILIALHSEANVEFNNKEDYEKLNKMKDLIDELLYEEDECPFSDLDEDEDEEMSFSEFKEFLRTYRK